MRLSLLCSPFCPYSARFSLFRLLSCVRRVYLIHLCMVIPLTVRYNTGSITLFNYYNIVLRAILSRVFFKILGTM